VIKQRTHRFTGRSYRRIGELIVIHQRVTNMNEVMKTYKSLLIKKRCSEITINMYCNYFENFCMYFKEQNLEQIATKKINFYILDLIKLKNISISKQNQRINAIKFYYEKVLGREKQCYELHRPKKEYKLPKVLSKIPLCQHSCRVNRN